MAGGKIVEIEELEDIRAIKPVRELSKSRLRSLGDWAEPPNDPVGLSDWNAFNRDGWQFVHPASEILGALERGTLPQGLATIKLVFRNDKGRIFLGTDRLSVRLSDELTEDLANDILRKEGLIQIRRSRAAKYHYIARSPSRMDFLEASMVLSGKPNFLYAEPQFIQHIVQRFKPSDPKYRKQWHLSNTGQKNGNQIKGTKGADIKAEGAWDTRQGDGMRIALIDSGFDLLHPDLADAVLHSSAHYAIDADGNPIFNQGLKGYPDDDHGTFSAGMAVARANNFEGGCGVAHKASLIAISIPEILTEEILVRAIEYAVDPNNEVGDVSIGGAHVISISLGWDCCILSSDMKRAIDFSVEKGRDELGTPIFWAATNHNIPIEEDEVCAYENNISVGRSTSGDSHDNSGYGPELDFLATGVSVFSTFSGGRYGYGTGNSFATPTAAAVGALALEENPDLSWKDVRRILRETCDKIGSEPYDKNERNDRYGWGRINAARAVREAEKRYCKGCKSWLANDKDYLIHIHTILHRPVPIPRIRRGLNQN